MKKVLAALLVLCMVLTLFACGGNTDNGGGGSNPPASNGGGESSGGGDGGGAAQTGGAFPAEAGYFDPDFDYSQFKKFKVGYMCAATSFLYEMFDVAFADWSKRMNINYTGMWVSSGGSNEEYLSGIQTFVDQGYDGLLLDADPNLYPRITEICEDYDIPWISCMGLARDYSAPYALGSEIVWGPIFCPYVGFNQIYFGTSMAEKLIEWKEETYPDVPWEKVGFISTDYSLAPQLHERTTGAKMKWCEKFPQFGEFSADPNVNPKNFYVADTSSGTPDQVTVANLVTQIVSNNKDGIEVWLMAGTYDDMAMGCANAADSLGITEKTCVVTVGGSNLVVQWDAGIENAWRYAFFTAQSIYAEPIIAGLWSFMAGQANKETIWQDWVCVWDKGDIFEMSDEVDPLFGYPVVKRNDDGTPVVLEEHSFAQLLLPCQWIDIENYKHYLAWTDFYAYGEGNPGVYGYDPVTDLNAYNPRYDSAPDSYKTWPQ